jgi:hypothetical protein
MKTFPSKEFKAAVTSLNVVLKKEEITSIKIVGIKKEAVIIAFTETILDFIEKDQITKLPNDCIDFYNTYIVETDENAEPEVETAEDPVAPKKKKKKEKKEIPKKEKKEKKEKTPGIMVLGIKAYMEDGCRTAQEIVDYVQPYFPDRNITKTLHHVYTIVKNIRPYEK